MRATNRRSRAKSWAVLAQNVPFNSINEKKLDKRHPLREVRPHRKPISPSPARSTASICMARTRTIYYHARNARPRSIPRDLRPVYQQPDAFNANGLYTSQHGDLWRTRPMARRPGRRRSTTTPETSVAITGTTASRAVCAMAARSPVSRISLLSDGTSKGGWILAIDDAAAGASATASLEGARPRRAWFSTVPRRVRAWTSPPERHQLAMRWTPVVPNESLQPSAK